MGYQEAISVLNGNSFVVSDAHGDVHPDSRVPPNGFFSQDTRFISLWRLSIQGQPTDVLSTAHLDYFVGDFFLVNRSPELFAAPELGIVRQRLVADAWLEDVVVVNHRDEDVHVALDIEVGTDFADLFEVKDNAIRERNITTDRGDRELVMRYRNGGVLRETRITVNEPAAIEENALRLSLWLASREERRISFVITGSSRFHHERTTYRPAGALNQLRQARRAELKAWMDGAPRLQSDSDLLTRVYDRSLIDLAALRFYPHTSRQDVSVPAAGLPWFMTLFGRDSLICSYQALPYRPEFARSTLSTLAASQGTAFDDFRDEEPGKILHEIRFGELTATGERPHSPYYGAADSTPLFLILLDEYEKWTGDADLVRLLEPNARQALEWIDRYGDLDNDGYIEYQTRNPDSGLVNQCWKDSWNSILFADGQVAVGPIATCEIQGYAYDAKRRAARLAREAWRDPPLAERLEAEADALRRRFLEDFWTPERGCFALALDGQKRQVDSLCSNLGHLLWSGIVDEARADIIASQLMDTPLWCGWGVRTMASTEGGYNPVEYHNGTVWPHDNSLIAAGLRRYGHHRAAARIAEAVVCAASFFEYRLPEVFAGCDKELTHAPVQYPTACSPQAWAAAAPLLLLTTVLGLSPAPDGPRIDPQLPDMFGETLLTGLPGRWGRADPTIQTSWSARGGG